MNAPEHQAMAETAHRLLDRAAGVAKQIADGSTALPTDQDHAHDVVARLSAAAESARLARAMIDGPDLRGTATRPWSSGLPLNRKERFYTGTVLPALAASHEFWHFQRLLDLFELPVALQPGDFDKVQFLTEYGFAESVYTEEDKARLRTDLKRDTPDVVAVGAGWLLVIEAKMFHNPGADELRAQLELQAPLVRHWQEVLEIADDHVVHALLLPERLARRHQAGLEDVTVVTWEQVLEAYRRVADRYWVGVLQEALDRHEELESPAKAFGANRSALLTGQAIAERWQANDAEFTFMGRNRGLRGPEMADDIASGGWRTRTYEVRHEPLVQRNWFAIAEFMALLKGAGEVEA